MRDSAACSNCRLAIAEGIPCDSKPWIEVSPIGLNARLAVKARIIRIGKTARSAGNYGTLLVRTESRQTEIVEIALRERHREKRLPPKTISQRDFRCDFPGILPINTKKVLCQVKRIWIRLPKLGHLAEEEVCHSEPSNLSVDGVRTDRPCLGNRPFDGVHEVAPPRELMRALHDADIVVGSEPCRVRK